MLQSQIKPSGPFLFFCLIVLSCTWLGVHADSQAHIRDRHSGSRPFTLDAPVVGLDFYGLGLTAGVRLGIPIVASGFIPSINNAVYIHVGADFYYTGNGKREYGVAIGLPVMLHWEFYFTQKWSAFAEVGVNVYLNSELFRGKGFLPGARWFIGAVGGKLHISSHFALVLRVGSPYTSFGLSFAF